MNDPSLGEIMRDTVSGIEAKLAEMRDLMAQIKTVLDLIHQAQKKDKPL